MIEDNTNFRMNNICGIVFMKMHTFFVYAIVISGKIIRGSLLLYV